ILRIEKASNQSVRTIFSGPAGGALLGPFIARLKGIQDVITFDMGGTSLDVCLTRQRRINIVNEGEIDGLPIRVPMIDMHTIGSGGGSIAWIDPGGLIQVGPESAGATPGPACYGRGGTDPTVTDANVALGYINPNYFLGGEMSIDLQKARGAISEKIAIPLDIQVEDAAMGIIEVVNSNMIRGIKVISVEKGHDPREFSLIAFGGAGPLHAAAMAQELRMSQIIIPPNPGNASAFGFLLADVRHDYVQTFMIDEERIKMEKINLIFTRLEKSALEDLKNEGFHDRDIKLLRSIDMRYQGQSTELNVPLDFKIEKDIDIQKIIEEFHQRHQDYYGYRMDDEKVMFINFRLTAIGVVPSISITPLPMEGGNVKDAFKGDRQIYIKNEWIACPTFERTKLKPGMLIDGPAIIEEYGSTTIVPPSMTAEIDAYQNIVLKT
ncbi:MAG: hydantoinase/oxoprolinase family protein, partial [Candidatus Helarchaeales archaeon]